MPGFLPRKATSQSNRYKLKVFNEKYLVLLLLLISTITIFVILMKLPPDIQRAVNRDVNQVFIPSIEKNRQHHNEMHQHPPPPLFHDFDDADDKASHRDNNNQIEPHHDVENNKKDNQNSDSSNLSIQEKREKIKQVRFFYL
jgi:hypothetical protein